jgi:hypothetical protein
MENNLGLLIYVGIAMRSGNLCLLYPLYNPTLVDTATFPNLVYLEISPNTALAYVIELPDGTRSVIGANIIDGEHLEILGPL